MKETAFERRQKGDLKVAFDERAMAAEEMTTVDCTTCGLQLYLPARTLQAKTWQCPGCKTIHLS